MSGGSQARRGLFPPLAVLLAVVVTLPLLEGLLRLEYAVRQRYRPSLAFVGGELGWLPTPGLAITFDKRGYGRISYSTTADGFRTFGNPASTKVKVWAVGDSTTQAYQVSDGQAYYDVLALLDPRFEVFGYGVGGYGTVQQAMVLERYWDQVRPDVVLWQMCGNDLINNDLELESSSYEHNNHMARPYLIDGRTELRHPDLGLGWWADRSLLARRIAVLRTSLRKRSGDSIESRLHVDHPALRRTVATTRAAIQRAISRAPGAPIFLAFFVPSPEGYSWEIAAWDEICRLPELECLPQVHEAVEAARRAGTVVDGGDDPHWNAAGHEIAARAILDRLRRFGPR